MPIGDEEPLQDWEYPQQRDVEDDRQDVLAEIVPCPHCGRAVYEDAQQCPYCKEWITASAAGGGDRWYVRLGRYLTKVLVLNWVFWIVATTAAMLAVLWRMLR